MTTGYVSEVGFSGIGGGGGGGGGGSKYVHDLYASHLIDQPITGGADAAQSILFGSPQTSPSGLTTIAADGEITFSRDANILISFSLSISRTTSFSTTQILTQWKLNGIPQTDSKVCIVDDMNTCTSQETTIALEVSASSSIIYYMGYTSNAISSGNDGLLRAITSTINSGIIIGSAPSAAINITELVAI